MSVKTASAGLARAYCWLSTNISASSAQEDEWSLPSDLHLPRGGTLLPGVCPPAEAFQGQIRHSFPGFGAGEGIKSFHKYTALSCAEDPDPGEGHQDRTSLHCGLGRKGVWTGKGCS